MTTELGPLGDWVTKKAVSIAQIVDTDNENGNGVISLQNVLKLCWKLWRKEMDEAGKQVPVSSGDSEISLDELWRFLAEALDLNEEDLGDTSDEPKELSSLSLSTTRLPELGRALRSFGRGATSC